jgi:hypothetical protein
MVLGYTIAADEITTAAFFLSLDDGVSASGQPCAVCFAMLEHKATATGGGKSYTKVRFSGLSG